MHFVNVISKSDSRNITIGWKEKGIKKKIMANMDNKVKSILIKSAKITNSPERVL